MQSSNIHLLLNQAAAFHRRGNFAEAARLYSQILTTTPDHFDAQHMLGVLRHQQGQHAEALVLIGTALQANPNSADALSNYAIVLNRLGRHQEALACNDKALTIRPDYAEAHNGRGIALLDLARNEEALSAFDRALTIRPHFHDALNNRGKALKKLMRHSEALVNYEQALELKPDFAEAHYNRGNTLVELKRHHDAIISYDKALAVQPNHIGALCNRGYLLLELARHAEALRSFDQAIATKRDDAGANYGRGRALGYLGRYDEATIALNEALARKGVTFSRRPSPNVPAHLSIILCGRPSSESEPSTKVSLQSNFIATEWIVEQRPLSSLASIVNEWRDLAARPLEPNVFYEPAYALPANGLAGGDVNVILVWSKPSPKRLVGFYPFRIERNHPSLPFPVLVGWKPVSAAIYTPLIDRDGNEHVLQATLDYIARSSLLPKIVLFPYLAEQGKFAVTLRHVIASRGDRIAMYGRFKRALLLPPDNRSTYLSHAISGKKRKKLRYLRRRLEEVGRVEYVTTTEYSEIPAALSDFFVLEASGWKGRAGSAVSSSPKFQQFMETAALRLSSEGKIRVDRLMVDNRSIAAAIIIKSQSAAWLWKIAYDETYARFSPGVLNMLDLTQSLLADSTIMSADSSTAPDHPMIDHIWREDLPVSLCIAGIGPEAEQTFALASCIEGYEHSAPPTFIRPRKAQAVEETNDPP